MVRLNNILSQMLLLTKRDWSIKPKLWKCVDLSVVNICLVVFWWTMSPNGLFLIWNKIFAFFHVVWNPIKSHSTVTLISFWWYCEVLKCFTDSFQRVTSSKKGNNISYWYLWVLSYQFPWCFFRMMQKLKITKQI